MCMSSSQERPKCKVVSNFSVCIGNIGKPALVSCLIITIGSNGVSCSLPIIRKCNFMFFSSKHSKIYNYFKQIKLMNLNSEELNDTMYKI